MVRSDRLASAVAFLVLPLWMTAVSQAGAAGKCQVRPDEKLNRQFRLTGPGWVAGDGATTVPAGRTGTLWVFSDSITGRADRRGKLLGSATLVRNAAAFQAHGRWRWLGATADPDGAPEARAVWRADESDDQKSWYWTTGAYRSGRRAYVFLGRWDTIGDGRGGTRMAPAGTAVSTIDLRTGAIGSIRSLPFRDEVVWGGGFARQGRYVYIYGWAPSRSPQELVVARTASRDLGDGSAWAFRTQKGWSRDPDAAVAVTSGFSGGVSLMTDHGRWYLLSQRSVFSPDVVVMRGNSPAGPWSRARTVFRTPETGRGDLFTYWAVAQGSLSTRDDLEVSYGVDTGGGLQAIFADLNRYRPRFVRMSRACWAF